MCYGGLDPKYQMREIEARVKTFGYEQKTQKQAAHETSPGLMARAKAIVDWLLRKDVRNV